MTDTVPVMQALQEVTLIHGWRAKDGTVYAGDGYPVPLRRFVLDNDHCVALLVAAEQSSASTPAVDREAVNRTLERLRWKLGHVSIDAMEGDNLAVTLCTRFEDADGEQDENGWTEAAVNGCDATLSAIHALYADAILALHVPEQSREDRIDTAWSLLIEAGDEDAKWTAEKIVDALFPQTKDADNA